MRKGITITILGILVAFATAVLLPSGPSYAAGCSITASGRTFNMSSYQCSVYNNYLNNSGGRGNIESVQWASAVAATQGVQACSLWMGPVGDSVTVGVNISAAEVMSGWSTVAFYGMCTTGTAYAVNIKVSQDNGSIKNYSTSMFRGSWASPGSMTASLDVNAFLGSSNLEVLEDTDTYTKYKMVVNLYRCHGSNPSSCSNQDVPLTATVEKTEISDGYYSISNASNRSTLTADNGGWVHTKLNKAGNGVDVAYTANREYYFSDGDGGSVDVNMTFSHNVYSSLPDDGISWEVTREVSYNIKGGSSGMNNGLPGTTSYYRSVSTSETAYSSGGTSYSTGVMSTISETNASSNGYYIAKDRNYTDGGSIFVLRDFYTITFIAEGEYTVCETMAVSGSDATPVKTTKSCSKVTIKENPTCIGDCCDGDCPPDNQLCQTWAPASYRNSSSYEGTTSVLAQVMNNGSSYSGYRNQLSGAYSGWRGQINEGTSPASASVAANKTTYARPGDVVRWLNCYYPGVQKVANTNRSSYHGGEGLYTNGTSNGNKPAWQFGTWQNQYTVNSESSSKNTFGGAKPSAQLNIGTGVTGIKYSSNTYTIKALNDAGKYFQETITSGGPVYVDMANEGRHNWRCFPYTCGCPYNCHTCYSSCSHSQDYVRADSWIIGPVVSGAARVEVPYNFNNSTSVSVAVDKDEPVYSGYSVTVNYAAVTVGQKTNSVVEDTYATQVDNAKVRLVAYVSSSNEDGQSTALYDAYGGLNWCGSRSWSNWRQCSVNASADGVALNYDSSVIDVLDGGVENNQFRIPTSGTGYTLTDEFQKDYTVFDANAGEYMCFAMAVWPSGSGSDTNLDPAGNRTWAISKTCRVIAKKPSFQVYGGSVYANGMVEMATSVKYNVFPNYSALDKTASTIFGSVVEQSVIGLGTVKDLASAASTGLSYGLIGASGGVESNSGDFCKYRTALSFANYGNIGSGCPSVQTTGNAGIVHSTTDRASLVSYWVPADTDLSSNDGTVNWSGMETIPSPSGRNIRYVYSTGDLTAGAVNVGLDTTYIVRTQRDVEITGNIIYSGAAMGSIDRIPKVVIYAAGNITIACGVTEVDAILIAGDGVHGGEVRTCGNYNSENSPSNIGDANDPNRSIAQLNIRGMVIADKMVLGRTYGAAAGSIWSGLPAEAINYDTSAILWGRYMAGSAESDTLTVTYQHELAPRY